MENPKQEIKIAGDAVFLIYSREHNAWWGHDERGYVNSAELAGRYSMEDAYRIVEKCNQYIGDDYRGVDEFMYPSPEYTMSLMISDSERMKDDSTEG